MTLGKAAIWYFGAGVGLEFLAQLGIPLPGIPPVTAPGALPALLTWPLGFLQSLLAPRPSYPVYPGMPSYPGYSYPNYPPPAPGLYQ